MSRYKPGDQITVQVRWYTSTGKRKESMIQASISAIGETDDRGFSRDVGGFFYNDDGSPFRGTMIRFTGSVNGAQIWGCRPEHEVRKYIPYEANGVNKDSGGEGQLSLPMVPMAP